MNIDAILSLERTFCRVEASSKKKAIEVASHLIAESDANLDESEIYAKLTAREKVSPTCLGEGIAIPHCRLGNCSKIMAALVTLSKPVEFEAIDDKPVNILFILLVPEAETEAHLKTMAMLVERLEQSPYREQLVNATSSEELFASACSEPGAAVRQSSGH